MDEKQLLSLIIPVYYEEEVLEESYARMEAAMRSTGHPYEIIYVNDGSRDGTMKILRRLAKEHEEVKVLSFSRNFGHQLAVTCGMDAAKGAALIIIDVDLQDPPEIIPQMVERWKAGAEIVYGKRAKREGESIFKKLSASVYYRLLKSMSAYPIPLDTGDFRLLDRKVADIFLEMRENARFLRGMSAWMGFTAEPLEYVRQERAAGKTKYTMKKMLKLATDGITGFSTKPLTLPGSIGIVLSVAALLVMILSVVMWFVRPYDKIIWIYSFGISAFTLFQGIMLCAIGIQGMYLGRVYDEVKRRPLYIVAEKLNI